MKCKKQAKELDIAIQYWRIKMMGSVEDIAKEHGITRPTVLRIAYEFEDAAKEALSKESA